MFLSTWQPATNMPAANIGRESIPRTNIAHTNITGMNIHLQEKGRTMGKIMDRYEIGKAVAEQSEGRITLTIEDSIATLRGEFTRKDRQPIRYKNGGWRYRKDDSGEFWTLSIKRIADKLEGETAAKSSDEPQVEPSAEPSAEGAVESGAVYVRWNGEKAEEFRASRSTKSSVWLVGADGAEFRKAVGEDAERLSGGFIKVF